MGAQLAETTLAVLLASTEIPGNTHSAQTELPSPLYESYFSGELFERDTW